MVETPNKLAVVRAVSTGEPMVAGKSRRGVAGCVWRDNVKECLHHLDPATGAAIGVARSLGVEDPMHIAWGGSTMYRIDNHTDAL